MNAHHKRLDVWLLARCAGCGDTVRLTVLERVRVRAVPPDLLAGYTGDDPALTARTLADPALRRRNGVALDWDGAWALRTPVRGPGPDPVELAVEVRFAEPVPVRTDRILAAGLGISRAEVARYVRTGVIHGKRRLDGRSSGGFAVTVRPWIAAGPE